MIEVLRANFCSPLTLAFAFGIFARVIRSELALPRDLYASLSFYLLFAIGLRGGVELSHSNPLDLAFPAIATLLTGCITPLTLWLVLRRIGRFSISDAAGIAAHYGSVSAVTFVAAQQFAASRGACRGGLHAGTAGDAGDSRHSDCDWAWFVATAAGAVSS